MFTNPKEHVCKNEDQKTDEGWEKMEEIEIAYGKVHADSAAEPGATHDRHDLYEAPVEFGAMGSKKEETADRA